MHARLKEISFHWVRRRSVYSFPDPKARDLLCPAVDRRSPAY